MAVPGTLPTTYPRAKIQRIEIRVLSVLRLDVIIYNISKLTLFGQWTLSRVLSFENIFAGRNEPNISPIESITCTSSTGLTTNRS